MTSNSSLERAVADQFAARADQRLHLRVGLDDGALADLVDAAGSDQRFQIRGHGGGGLVRGFRRLHEDHLVIGGARGRIGAGEFQGEVACHHAVADGERCFVLQSLPVQQRAILAAQVLHFPRAAVAGKSHVLPRKARIIGVSELTGAGTAERNPVAIERHQNRLAVTIPDDKLGRNLGRDLRICSHGF